MVPCVDDACAHVFSLRRDLVAVGRFLDVDRELLVSPAQVSTSESLEPATRCLQSSTSSEHLLDVLRRAQWRGHRAGRPTLYGSEKWMQCDGDGLGAPGSLGEPLTSLGVLKEVSQDVSLCKSSLRGRLRGRLRD